MADQPLYLPPFFSIYSLSKNPFSLSKLSSQIFFLFNPTKNLIFLLISLLCSSPMAQRSHVPAFGNWESEGNVPYTVFFDKARKGRGGGPIRNPNDPEEYPEMLMDNSHQPASTKSNPKDDIPPPKPTTHERRHSREDAGLRPYANPPGNRENPPRRQSGSEYSIDRSPLHRHAKPSGRDSPVTEGKSFEGGYGNRGKARMKNDAAPEGTAVPKFGSWDVNNPASADGFTHIFGKVREERMWSGTPPPQHSSSPYNNANNRRPDDSAKGGCFPCLRGK